MAAVRGSLAGMIKKHHVVVVQKSWCPFCVRVVKALEAYAPKDMMLLDADAEPAWQAESTQMTGQRTVPQVFIGGTHVGGCDDTMALDRAGQLEPMLAKR